MDEPENPTPEQAPRNKKKRLFPILAAVLVLGVIGGGAALAMKFRGAPKTEKQATKPKSMMNLEPFLVNLADADANRFVKVTFRLGINEEGLGEKYEKDPIILSTTRDRILSLLTTKTADQILTPEGKDALRKQIIEKLTPVFPEGKVVEVFILDFVVQL